MNMTDFRDNALLKLQVGGPFTGRMVDPTNQEFILVQVEQTEEVGPRRRRGQQVTNRNPSLPETSWSMVLFEWLLMRGHGYFILHVAKAFGTNLTQLTLSFVPDQVIHNWTIPLHSERNEQVLMTKTFEMLSRYQHPIDNI